MSDLTKQFEGLDQKLDKTLEGIGEAKQKAATLETEIGGIKTTVTAVDAAVKEAQNIINTKTTELSNQIKVVNDEVDKIKADSAKKVPQSKGENGKTFNDILAETIERNADEIRNYRKEKGLVGFDMMPEIKAKNNKDEREVKAVGDMSIAANFAAAPSLNVDVRSNQLIEKPYERLWLADVLPGGASNGSSILYPKENGGEGGAALWTDKTADKAQMDFDLTGQSAYFKWLAGYVIIEREMLDDITFLISYLQNKMLVSLKIAENSFILNGSADTNPVQGMLAAATAYSGDQGVAVDRIIDAAWGQIVEDTFEFYNPTHTILTPRDAVKIGLNKAAGSGEYDLPNGSVAFVNGKLQIAGLQNVTTTTVGTGNFLAFDARATMFIKRMQPELRMFEDAALAKKNKIMFRIEERATLAIFNNAAIVTGTLAGA